MDVQAGLVAFRRRLAAQDPDALDTIVALVERLVTAGAPPDLTLRLGLEAAAESTNLGIHKAKRDALYDLLFELAVRADRPADGLDVLEARLETMAVNEGVGPFNANLRNLLLFMNYRAHPRDDAIVLPASLVGPQKKKTVCFYLGAAPTADVKASVYGSELMAYRLAEEMAKEFEVYVVGIYVLHAYEKRGVRYLPSRVLYQLPRFAPPGFKFDVMVVSRYVEYFVDFDARALADRTLVWVHDNHVVGFYQNMPMKDDGRGLVRNLDLATVDAFVALSPWHERCLAELYGPAVAAKIRVVPNCYDEAAFSRLEEVCDQKVPLSFVWVSCPDRGLADVVRHFPAIAERFPGATLHIYRKAMPELQKGAHPAITFHGFAPNDVVIAAMARADYWLYPTDFKESSCISAMEAQRAGCVCIATRVAALATTLGPDTLFVDASTERWAQVLERIAFCEANPDEKARIRASGRAWAAQNTAAGVAAQWRDLFVK